MRIDLLLVLVVSASGPVWAQNKALSLDGDVDYMEVADSDSLRPSNSDNCGNVDTGFVSCW